MHRAFLHDTVAGMLQVPLGPVLQDEDDLAGDEHVVVERARAVHGCHSARREVRISVVCPVRHDEPEPADRACCAVRTSEA